MTLRKLTKLYRYYKDDYDFRLTGQSYGELEEKINHEGEFIPD